MKGLSLNQQKHYFCLSPLTTNILFPWHWCHLGNKSVGRKWRDNKEIMWKKQHLILISQWRGGGGGVEGWRAKLKELKWPTEWETNSYQGEKCCFRATRGCVLRGVGVNQNVRWGRGSALLRETRRYMKLKKTDSCCIKQDTFILSWARQYVHHASSTD